MTRLLRAEVLKLLTVRSLLWIVLAEIALVVIPLLSVAAASNSDGSASDDKGIAQIAASSIVFALLLGIVVLASEGAQGTITQTLLVTPIRERVLVAKAIVAAVTGGLLAVLADAIVVLVGVPAASLHVGHARLVLAGIVLAAALAGALGVGIGALFHRQGSAITVSLIWLLVGEHLSTLALKDNVKFAPGHVFGAVVTGNRSGSDIALGVGPGLIAAAVYTLAFLVIGGALLARRDV